MPRAYLVICAAVGASTGIVAHAQPAPSTSRSVAAARRGCGGITAQGCCDGTRLWWCEAGVLRNVDCAARPRCGWRERGAYDCDTAGSFDPAGRHPRHCSFGDAGPPQRGPDGSPCGPITVEGCCDGELLRYCEDGRLRAVDCGRNPLCGWRGVGQLYNCGTTGEADPRGRFPQACPKAPPLSAAAGGVTIDLTRARPAPDAGVAPPPDAGSCALAPTGHAPATAALLVGALLLVASRRARGPRRGG